MSTLPELAIQLETIKSFTPSASGTPEQERELDFERFAKEDAILDSRETTGTTRVRRGSFASSLHPVDRGPHAMKFLLASFVLETFIWGYGFTFSLIFVRSLPCVETTAKRDSRCSRVSCNQGRRAETDLEFRLCRFI